MSRERPATGLDCDGWEAIEVADTEALCEFHFEDRSGTSCIQQCGESRSAAAARVEDNLEQR